MAAFPGISPPSYQSLILDWLLFPLLISLVCSPCSRLLSFSLFRAVFIVFFPSNHTVFSAKNKTNQTLYSKSIHLQHPENASVQRYPQAGCSSNGTREGKGDGKVPGRYHQA